MPRPRVLVVFEPPHGGVPAYVRAVAPGLRDRGFDVTVAGRAEAGPRAALQAAGLRYVVLPIVGDMVDARRDLATARAIGRLLREGRFDVVQAHGQKPGLLARVVAAPLRVPVVWWPHSLVHRHQLDVPSPGARGRYRKTLLMERALRPLTAATVGVSEEERTAAVADGLIASGRSRTVLNGVDVDAGAPPDEGLLAFRGDGPLLGMVAALRDQKGLPTLLDALERLAIRGDAVRFVIVGNGPLEAEVRARVASGPLAATTLVAPFAGRVEPYLAALDGFVLPSYWEGLPLAILEAMHVGLPVVASDVGGTSEAVVDGTTGLLVAPRDAGALAAALASVAADEALRGRLGAAGRARARERFGAGRMIDETAAVLREFAAPVRGD